MKLITKSKIFLATCLVASFAYAASDSEQLSQAEWGASGKQVARSSQLIDSQNQDVSMPITHKLLLNCSVATGQTDGSAFSELSFERLKWILRIQNVGNITDHEAFLTRFDAAQNLAELISALDHNWYRWND